MCFSVKFVGLFVTVLIGASTIAELWQLLGDLTLPMVCNNLLHDYLPKNFSSYRITK